MTLKHYIVGDIHGCIKEYLDLESKIMKHAEKSKATPFIVSVGDLVDRGPDSAAVVAYFREGYQKKTHAVVMGNHEAEFILNLIEFSPKIQSFGFQLPNYILGHNADFESERSQFARNLSLDEYRQLRRLMWIGQGGSTTLRSFNCDPTSPATWIIDRQDLEFLINLPLIWENESAIVTHALANQNAIQLAQTRDVRTVLTKDQRKQLFDLMWNRVLPKSRIDKHKVHLSGHTPLLRVKNHKKIGAIQIDTGCVYGRKLTAYCLETKEYLYVSAAESYAKS
ncbi:MAG: metallophosphoesterase [Proteobacteria bacterium]|nr:metallophosphoesterase [Pseudomonadota bacterium]